MSGSGTVAYSPPMPSLSSLREYLGVVYAPQMLSSPPEVPNPAEDKAVRVVAPTSKADDAVPPAKILPGRPDGVSFACRSGRGLLSSLLRVSICTDGMAGYTWEWSAHVHSCLLLAIP